MYIPNGDSTSPYKIDYTWPDYITCPCCGGSGVQVRPYDGLKVLCPECDGSGQIPRPITRIPGPIYYRNNVGDHWVTCDTTGDITFTT